MKTKDLLNRADALRWLLLPAFVSLFLSLKTLKNAETQDEKDELLDKTFSAISVILVYGAVIFIVIQQLTRPELPMMIIAN